MPDISPWLHYGAFGILSLGLVAVGWFLWHVWKWFTTRIAEPFIQAHNKMLLRTQSFMDSFEEHMKCEERFQQRLADNQEAITKTLTVLSAHVMAKSG